MYSSFFRNQLVHKVTFNVFQNIFKCYNQVSLINLLFMRMKSFAAFYFHKLVRLRMSRPILLLTPYSIKLRKIHIVPRFYSILVMYILNQILIQLSKYIQNLLSNSQRKAPIINVSPKYIALLENLRKLNHSCKISNLILSMTILNSPSLKVKQPSPKYLQKAPLQPMLVKK